MMDGFTAQVVLEHHPDPLVVVDRNQHCTFANRAFAEIVAIKAVELIGKSVDVFALAGAEWRIDSQPIMDTQAGLVGTVHYFRRKPISAQARSAYQRGNRPNSLATFSEQEEHLCEAQRLARIGSWCWEPPSGAIWWSEMTHELFGLEPGSVVPSIEIFLAMVHPDDRSLYVDALERVLTGPVEFADDLRIIRRDGKCIWLHSRGRVTRNEAGRPIFVEGTVQDISDRKAAEQTLNTTSNLLQAVASGTTDAMFVKDRAGKYLFFNEAAAKFVGKPVAEVIGKDDFSVFERESARAIRERDERVMLFGVPETKEETLTAAGTTRTYLATKGPYFDQRGEVIGIIGISRDITLRKEAEQALKLTHSVVSILAQADDISDAAPQVLGVIAHAMGWSQGEFWCYVEEMHCLRRTACWPESNQHDPTDLPEHSLASSKPSTENPLENPLPVFVWSRQQALTRQQIAESTFAFPILSEGHVLAVAMFQSASPIQLSDRLQQTFDSIGVQLGVFFKRKQASNACGCSARWSTSPTTSLK